MIGFALIFATLRRTSSGGGDRSGRAELLHLPVRGALMGAQGRLSSRSSSSLIAVDITCPTTVSKSKNDNNGFFKDYVDNMNINEGSTLQAKVGDLSSDAWNTPHAYVNDLLRQWKTDVFVPNLQSGDSIYESGCGTGMNLLLTTQILAEHNISDIHVYGNDYLKASVDTANHNWDDPAIANLTNHAHKMQFCQADSTNLAHIPSNSFDLVYTGFLDPLSDPLHLTKDGTTRVEQILASAALCNSSLSLLADKEQVLQEQWFSSWTTELIRLAKPGKIIAIESGAPSICSATDAGGVDREWWRKKAIHDWDVDSESIFFGDFLHPNFRRYHVMMRKNDNSDPIKR
jgi:SAM-dependent methyltransferase